MNIGQSTIVHLSIPELLSVESKICKDVPVVSVRLANSDSSPRVMIQVISLATLNLV